MRKSLVVLLTALALVLGFASFADAAATKKSFKVSIKSSVGTSQAGRFITISGKVTGPKSGGKKVTIQRQYVGGAWTTVATVITKPSGKYKARVETPQGGTTSFRAIKAKSSARKAGVSPTKALAVYEWLYLASEAGLQGDDLSRGVEATIGGKNYKRSIGASADTGLTYKTAGLCTAFTTVVDYRKSSGSDDEMTFALHRQQSPSTTLHKVTQVSTGVPVTVTSTVAGTQFLSLELASIQSGGAYFVSLGDPRVYCNAHFLPSFGNGDL